MTRRLTMRFTASLLAVAAALSPAAASLWPIPKEIKSGSQIGFIKPNLLVTYNGDAVSLVTLESKPY